MYTSNPQIITSSTTAVQRFLSYVKIDTTSEPSSDCFPSTEGQLLLGNILVKELIELGISNAKIDSNGYVTARLEGDKKTSIALIAHLDTSNACRGYRITPLLHKDYQCTDIILKNEVIITTKENPALLDCIGHTIITSDGTTLLGADDKAGIAIIMGVLEYFQKNKKLSRPTIEVIFTPDEEIGRGTYKFPYKEINSDTALTVDGTFPGEINTETFEAWSMNILFKGIATHPGSAKNKMVNALKYASEFICKLPPEKSPEHTFGRQGFIHPVLIKGDSSQCETTLILRDFSEKGILLLKKTIKQIISKIEKQEPKLTVLIEESYSYPNMNKFLERKQDFLRSLEKAVLKSGLKPSIVPIRGGTDGANLSKNGLPTPNIFTGAMNIHGPTEWISVENMGYSLCVIINLMALYSG